MAVGKPDRAARAAINFDLYKPWVVTRLERLIRREVKRAVEEAAKIAEAHAEYLKHASHVDGLGFGDYRGERACKAIAAAIRARSTRSK